MRTLPPPRCAAVLALSLALLPRVAAQTSPADDTSGAGVLLGRARTLEQRGRLDLARQNWLDVLAVSPNNAEALAGLVRAARAAGHNEEARQYLARLRAAHPADPEITRLGAANEPNAASKPTSTSSADLAEAARLAQTGDASAAMAIYRRVYGETPPAGAPAVTYYETEAATADGRPRAIAGLRALSDRYPNDAHYAVALGKLLLGSPRTRGEGRTLLERYPADPAAVAALRSGGAAEEHTAAVSSANKPLAIPQAPATSNPVERVQTSTAASASLRAVSASSAPGKRQALAADEQAGFVALNQHRTADAETIFRSILSRNPADSRALAGLGYLRSTSGDLKGAVNYFEQAQENGDRSLALTRALVNAQFAYSLQGADAAVARGDLAEAQTRYQDALRERPSDPDALDGLGEVLLRSDQLAAAIPVFTRLTNVRPMSPAAWRGLVVAEAGAGRPAEALATDARVPTGVRAPLTADAPYQQALATARVQPPAAAAIPSPVQVARATIPTQSALPPAPAPAPVVPPPPPGHPAASSASPAPAPSADAAITHPSVPQARPPASAPASPSSVVSTAAIAPARPLTDTASPPHTRRRPHPAAGNVEVAKGTPPAPPIPAAMAPDPPALPSDDAIAAERVSQAEAAFAHSEYPRATDLFREAITHQPQRADAWKGLVAALHAEAHDTEAAAALALVPSSVAPTLTHDATLQQTAGVIYLRANRPSDALHAWEGAQDIFAAQRLAPPLELVLDVARLLASRGDDKSLYRQLMYLGTRKDLADAQRREVQLIWTRWAVRRARSLAAAGEQPRAVVVLNAAAEAFAGNPEVLRAVADGYAGIGLPREAVAIYKALDPTRGSVSELTTAIRAAIAAHDYRCADTWTRAGREHFPNDAAMLTVAAELQQARGHQDRAAELTRQAKALALPQDAGQVLTAELRESPATPGLPSAGQLSVLLLPDEAAARTEPGQGRHPFLPGTTETAGSTGNVAEIPVLADVGGSWR